MNLNIEKLQKSVRTVILLFAASVLSNSIAISQSFGLSSVSDMVRVFEDGKDGVLKKIIREFKVR